MHTAFSVVEAFPLVSLGVGIIKGCHLPSITVERLKPEYNMRCSDCLQRKTEGT